MVSPRKSRDPQTLRPATCLVHGASVRSQFDETSEALFLTQGYLYDTMEVATPILKLPGQWGNYKWPSLDETLKGFGIDVPTGLPRHRADVDVLLTESVYWEIQRRNGHADAA